MAAGEECRFLPRSVLGQQGSLYCPHASEPNQAYGCADNGNRSVVHWDMVNIQRAGYGGGEIGFDDVLIREYGLLALNPENLKNWSFAPRSATMGKNARMRGVFFESA